MSAGDVRVLVVGSGGVGSAVAMIARRRSFFSAMVLADIDEARARRAAEATGDARFTSTQLDASDRVAVAECLRAHRCTHVLNAADPRFVMPVFGGAFDAGATYLDMAMSLSEPHPERPHEEPGVKLGDLQLAQSEAWAEQGLLAVVGIGVEPGLSDVFARHAADELFSTIDEIGVRDGADSSRCCRCSTRSGSTGPRRCGSGVRRWPHETSSPRASPTPPASATGCEGGPAPAPG